MRAATGAYYAFVDSDDFLVPDTYAQALQYIDEADLVCFGVQVFGESSPQQQASDSAYYRIRFGGVQKLTDPVIFQTDVSACNKIFKKDIIDKYHLTFLEGFYYEDAEFYCKYISCATTAYFIPKYFYHYRRNANSIMGHTFNGANRAIDHLYHVKHIYDFWRTNGFLYSHKKLFEKFFESWFDFAYRHCGIEQRHIVTKTATKYALEFNEVLRSKSAFMKALKRKWERKAFGPKVTVLLPVYNAQQYVAEAIESILSQTFTDFELLIINDGSTDRSAEIIEGYKDPRIIFVNNPHNQGLVTVLNQGLDMAHGEYIARMDADDVSLPDRLAKQVKFLDKHPKVGCLRTWFHIFGNIDRIEKKLKYPTLKCMINGCPVGHPTVMLRKAVFDKYQLRYNPAYKHAEDYELWTRVIKHTQIANLQEVLLNYRWTGSNISAVYEKEQSLVSEVIKQKIRKACKAKRYVLNYQIDDSKLLHELGNIEFHYMPNSGNMGDMLIAGATMQWFDKRHLKWQRVTPDTKQVDNLVYGGGGAWTAEWIADMKPVMNLMSKAKKVIILPSSFYNVPEFVSILDKRFIIFCREENSYNYLVAQHTEAKIVLDHDMAFRLEGRFRRFLLPPTRYLARRTLELKKQTATLQTSARLFRLDGESKHHYQTDYDLSDALGWFGPYEPRKNIEYAMQVMLNFVYPLQKVQTDRLHVAIAAALTGAEVELYDNSYGKINGVYRQTLWRLPNVTFHTEGE